MGDDGDSKHDKDDDFRMVGFEEFFDDEEDDVNDVDSINDADGADAVNCDGNGNGNGDGLP